MKSILIALCWAAALILLPLAVRNGLVHQATLEIMAPVLTMVAALHLTLRNRAARCWPMRKGGAV